MVSDDCVIHYLWACFFRLDAVIGWMISDLLALA